MSAEHWAQVLIDDGRELGLHSREHTQELYDQVLTLARVIKPLVDDTIKEVLTVAEESGIGE